MSESSRSESTPDGGEVWSCAVEALVLLAVDPAGLGGMTLRAQAGPVRDRWLELMAERMPVGAPVKRMPATITQDRLIGGLDLAATLSAGRPVAERGLLGDADGGLVIVAMAERVGGAAASALATALDTGVVRCERDGLAVTSRARFAAVLLDEGTADDERAAAKLRDRLAFSVDLASVSLRDTIDPLPSPAAIAVARAGLATVTIGDDMLAAITGAADALGIPSLRAALLAVKAARASAALQGRRAVSEDDASLAARLVLAPLATRVPQEAPEHQEPEEAPVEPPESQRESLPDTDLDGEPEHEKEPPQGDIGELQDMLLEAAKAAIPAGLLAQIMQSQTRTGAAATQGRAGAERMAERGGRPTASRRGDPRRGLKLDVVATLRAAAPWQTIRQREAIGRDGRRIEVRSQDFHIQRRKQRTETVAIFVVDASGSSALNRLAEAKGAVELLLADCYVRRDRVAVIAFRGTAAELLLPPTRSLVRAKRSLAGLPGGGATPLASAIDAGRALADAVRRRGQAPTLILLTDGRGNIARDGRAGRANAARDATAAARLVRAAGTASLLIDTSPKPQVDARALAGEMGALYLALPYASSATLSAAVRAARPSAPS